MLKCRQAFTQVCFILKRGRAFYGKNSTSPYHLQLKLCRQNFSSIQMYLAGHSEWQNRKYKKMHKDNARAKIFGKLSLEIIQSVREKGSDPNFNPKLGSIILKARSVCMPKDKIELSIKNAKRQSSEKLNRLILQARGPGKSGLMIEILSPNTARSKHEIRSILRRQGATFIEDGSVAFMFEHKGILTVEDTLSVNSDEVGDNAKNIAEEIAITIGAEDVEYNFDGERNVFQFICPPLEVDNLQKQFSAEYKHLNLLSADVQFLSKSQIILSSDELMSSNDILIDMLTDHHDVLMVYDNIKEFPSRTIKLKMEYA